MAASCLPGPSAPATPSSQCLSSICNALNHAVGLETTEPSLPKPTPTPKIEVEVTSRIYRCEDGGLQSLRGSLKHEMTLSGFSITAVTGSARLGPHSSVRLDIVAAKCIVRAMNGYLCLGPDSGRKPDSRASSQTEATRATRATTPKFYDNYDIFNS